MVAKGKDIKIKKDPHVFDSINHLRAVLYSVTDVRSNTIKKEAPNIRRGDLVWTNESANHGYRNNGKYIWDGKNLVNLYTEIDDYGSLPPDFTLNEFPDARYFSYAIDHNSIRWLRFDSKDIVNIESDLDRQGALKFVVRIETNGQKYEYTLLYEGKAKKKLNIYKSLKFLDGALAIEDTEESWDQSVDVELNELTEFVINNL